MTDPAAPTALLPVPEGTANRADTPPVPQVTSYPMRFTGSASEYFRIWIVNVALSVVTLGFYAPWARVRTRQYFYGNTWLDGHNFEYTADPWALLRGYLIVLVFAALYWLASTFQFQGSGTIIIVLVLLFVALYPWLVRQSMRFLARSTVHRGLNFRFDGSLGGSYFAYGVTNIAALFSAVLALPWAWATQRRYQVSGVAYGGAKGHFRGDTGNFYMIALIGLAMSLGGGLALGIVVAIFSGAIASLSSDLDALGGFSVGAILGIAAAYAGGLLLYAFSGQYVRSATMKYVLDNVELGGVVRLGAHFSPWRLVWINISNYFAQVFSLGLLTPWATIRRTRYIVDNIQVRALTSLDDFTAVSSAQENAIGEAATELFDINIGF